jgi:hypothetical protein
METERSDRAWDAYQQASARFDYFMVGLSSALTGYLGPRLALQPLGFNPSTMEFAAVVSFALSIAAGITRLEWIVAAIAGNHGRLYHEEAAGALASTAMKSDALLNAATGEVLTKDEAILKARGHKANADATREKLTTVIRRAERAYKWRNVLFYAGIVFLVASRLLAAYPM